jgi:TATA-box binding protein (TBP) (component of TFIID and TFIIIB)
MKTLGGAGVKGKFIPSVFPALVLKCKVGSAMLFNTGKINLLGIKSPGDFLRSRLEILDFIYAL